MPLAKLKSGLGDWSVNPPDTLFHKKKDRKEGKMNRKFSLSAREVTIVVKKVWLNQVIVSSVIGILQTQAIKKRIHPFS